MLIVFHSLPKPMVYHFWSCNIVLSISRLIDLCHLSSKNLRDKGRITTWNIFVWRILSQEWKLHGDSFRVAKDSSWAKNVLVNPQFSFVAGYLWTVSVNTGFILHSLAMINCWDSIGSGWMQEKGGLKICCTILYTYWGLKCTLILACSFSKNKMSFIPRILLRFKSYFKTF